MGKRHTGKTTDPGACLGCHSSHSGILEGPMARRNEEKKWTFKAFGKLAPRFFEERCKGCHVQGCLDCHAPKKGTHGVALPGIEACLKCHSGYFTGAEYAGLAPRDDHERYQRGPKLGGQHYLRMLPDVHFEKGLSCNACHTMGGHKSGRTRVKTCAECHPNPSPKVIEHQIPAHKEKLECFTCHASWAVQEYGTFLIEVTDKDRAEPFLKIRDLGGGWFKGSYLKEYGPPPIGLNAKGRYSPIRPEFIFFHTKVGPNGVEGKENALLGAFWKAFFPHTVQRATVLCPSCHEDPKRFVHANPDNEVYNLKNDGLPLASFSQAEGQVVVNGTFVGEAALKKRILLEGTHPYATLLVKKWAEILKSLPY